MAVLGSSFSRLSAEHCRQFVGDYPSIINKGRFKKLELLVPPLEEQAEIVRRIESAFGWLDRVAADHAAAARLLPKLNAAILAKAFRGELAPQDLKDEPATVLLERIRAERQSEGTKPKNGRVRPRVDDLEGNATGSTVVSRTLQVTRTKKKAALMSKSRQDDAVKNKPYLANLLKSGRFSDAQSLFRVANLPVADFYKQLAWEIDKGYILENAEELKAA
jgi:type I restriction enzyme S subunit